MDGIALITGISGLVIGFLANYGLMFRMFPLKTDFLREQSRLESLVERNREHALSEQKTIHHRLDAHYKILCQIAAKLNLPDDSCSTTNILK